MNDITELRKKLNINDDNLHGIYPHWRLDNPEYNLVEAWNEEEYPKATLRYFKESGCLVASLAIMLRLYGYENDCNEETFNPWILNERLKEINAFTPYANLIIPNISKLYPIEYLGRKPFSVELLKEYLSNGEPCLITVNGINGPRHFVVPISIKNGEVNIIDSAYNKKHLSDYDKSFNIFRFGKATPGIFDFNTLSNIKGINCKEKNSCVALTFDDGPTKYATNAVLDILEKNNCKATFFVVGENICGNEYLLKRMVKLGCQIGNHTWSHTLIKKSITIEKINDEIDSTNEAIEKCCSITPNIMRPPGGCYNDDLLAQLKEKNMSAITWSLDPMDWDVRNARIVIERVLQNIEDGDIVLFHDTYEEIGTAIEFLVPELKRRGFKLVTIDELSKERKSLLPGKIYSNFNME